MLKGQMSCQLEAGRAIVRVPRWNSMKGGNDASIASEWIRRRPRSINPLSTNIFFYGAVEFIFWFQYRVKANSDQARASQSKKLLVGIGAPGWFFSLVLPILPQKTSYYFFASDYDYFSTLCPRHNVPRLFFYRSECSDKKTILDSTMDSILALHPAAPGLILGFPKNFSEFLMLPRLIKGSRGQQMLNI